MTTQPQKITTCLWFTNNAKDAVEHYLSIFEGGRIVERSPGPDGADIVIVFELFGQRFQALNGRPPDLHFTDATSLSIACQTQDEVDSVWAKLLEGGGQASMCGWLKDRFGVSWQVIPDGLSALMTDPDRARAGRAMAAMLKMQKLDINAMRAAADAG